jgi:hypothetical protein
MRNSKLLIHACVTVAVLVGVSPSNACGPPQQHIDQSRGCDPPPAEILQKPRREYKGRYENKAYGYSVVIPKGFKGYDAVNPFYQRGFVIVFGEEPRAYINLYGEHNSFEDSSGDGKANRELGYLREEGKAIESAKITPTHIGGLPATQLLVTYTCAGSTERYVWFSTVVLSPDKGTDYEATLHTLASRLDHDRAILDRLLATWKYIGF